MMTASPGRAALARPWGIVVLLLAWLGGAAGTPPLATAAQAQPSGGLIRGLEPIRGVILPWFDPESNTAGNAVERPLPEGLAVLASPLGTPEVKLPREPVMGPSVVWSGFRPSPIRPARLSTRRARLTFAVEQRVKMPAADGAGSRSTWGMMPPVHRALQRSRAARICY